MDLISKTDALDKVHKTIENLILRLPKVRGVDGEDYCTDPASLAAYNMAYEHIRREIQSIPSWHTEDPEEGGEYLVTWEGVDHGRQKRYLLIAEWVEPVVNDDGDIIENGEWGFEPYIYSLKGDAIAWMPLPDLYDREV